MGWINAFGGAVWRLGQRVGGIAHPRAGTPSPTDDFWYTEFGTQNHAGVPVSPDIALKASALFAVVRILAETMSSLPLQMYRDLGERGREPAPDHPLDELIRFQPNHFQTAMEFWEMMMFHAVTRGTGYAEIVPGPRGAVDQLIPIHADRVRVDVLRDRSLRFDVTDPRTGARRRLLQEEVFRVPGLSSDGIKGLRVVDLAAEAIGLSLAADAYAARVFSNRLNIGGYLIHPGKLSGEAQKNLIQALMEKLAGIGNAHRPFVLQEGMKFERGSDTAKDSQLLEARKWQIAEIARFFRIPLHMLDIDDQTNRSTVEAQAQDFVKYVVRPHAHRIELAIRRDLIVAKRTYLAAFDLEDLLRGDSAARADYYAKALGSGGHAPWMKINEVRAREGLNPVPGGDEIKFPINEQSADAEDNAAAAIEDSSVGTKVERMVRKEVATMRRAMARYAGDAEGFEKFVTAFYGGHVSEVMDVLAMPKDVAVAYCNHVRDEVLNAEDLPATLARWLEERADEITNTLEAA